MEIRRDDHPEHLAADLHELLAEEAGELGVRAAVDGDVVSLHGSVATPERREECARVVAAALPGFRVDNQVEVLADELRPVAPEEQV